MSALAHERVLGDFLGHLAAPAVVVEDDEAAPTDALEEIIERRDLRTSLPKCSPLNSLRNVSGNLSRPSTISSLDFSIP